MDRSIIIYVSFTVAASAAAVVAALLWKSLT
jgi:hypothetical protein